MKIEARWHDPIALSDGKKNNLIYYTDTNIIPETSGCYVFYNKHGKSISILYVGKADNLRLRIDQQFNNLKLMMGIQNAINGRKFLMYCEVLGNPKAKKFKSNVKKLEKELIKYATLEGQELLNKKGIKIKYDWIDFKGNRDSEDMFGRRMNLTQK